MKLISLNIWGGKVFRPLIDFVKKEAETTDIFCFQEVFSEADKSVYEGARLDIFYDITSTTPDFKGYFSPSQNNFGLACFVKNDLKPEVENIFVYGKRDGMIKGDNSTLPRNLQIIKLVLDGKGLTVFNYHGLWRPGDKKDDHDRLTTSEKIREILSTIWGEKILCGDFNLLPDTKSLAILEDDMTNLIKKFDIKSARSELYTKEHKFADYILISPGVNVKKFEVLPDVVSDHLPMMLEFEL